MAEQRFCKPLHETTKPLINQPNSDTAETVLARRWALWAQTDSRLIDLIDGWSKLPDAIRDAVVHMVVAASKPFESV